jgi:hypothetical protein
MPDGWGYGCRRYIAALVGMGLTVHHMDSGYFFVAGYVTVGFIQSA